MANRKQYYGLDDVGFLGVSDKRSAADIQEDAKKTSDYIKSLKAETSASADNIEHSTSSKKPKAVKVRVAVTSGKKRPALVKSK